MSSAVASQRAGTKPATEDPTARQTRILLENCLKQAEEVDYLTAKVQALSKLDAQGKELVAALDAQIAAQQKTIEALKAANAAGDKIETISEKELKSYQASLDAAKAEIARWQRKASFWRTVASVGLPVLLLIGGVVGYALGNK